MVTTTNWGYGMKNLFLLSIVSIGMVCATPEATINSLHGMFEGEVELVDRLPNKATKKMAQAKMNKTVPVRFKSVEKSHADPKPPTVYVMPSPYANFYNPYFYGGAGWGGWGWGGYGAGYGGYGYPYYNNYYNPNYPYAHHHRRTSDEGSKHSNTKTVISNSFSAQEALF
eukprot:jgi/Bigna1/68737/fgenesh1_pg.7_\